MPETPVLDRRVPLASSGGWRLSVSGVLGALAAAYFAILFSGVLLPFAAALVIAGTFVTRFRDVAYGLVIVWAYAGVVVKEQDAALVADDRRLTRLAAALSSGHG